MSYEEMAGEHLSELPARLETASFFSPVVVVNTNVALAVNAVNLGGGQTAAALAGAGVTLGMS